jgi:hypothetical protein
MWGLAPTNREVVKWLSQQAPTLLLWVQLLPSLPFILLIIKMDKLLEYLNEYDPYIQGDWTFTDNFWYYVYQWHSAVFDKSIWENKIISKSYGFIKRLDKHNKIDRTYKKHLNYPYYIRRRDWELKWYKRYEMLTMLLSISNNPIKLLISMLK